MLRLLRIFFRSAEREGRFLRGSGWEMAMLLWLPLASVGLVWWIFSQGQIHDLPVGVLDEDGSPLSLQLTRFVNSTPSLRVTRQFTDAAQAQRALDAVEVYGVVVIPRDFAATLKQGHARPVVLQYNAQFGSFAGLIQRDVRLAVGTFSAGVEITAMNKRGTALNVAQQTFSPIRTNAVGLFNLSTNYQQFLAGTVIPTLLQILGMTTGAAAFGRELRDKTLGRWLAYALERDLNPAAAAPGFMETVLALNGKLVWPMLTFTAWGGMALWLDTHLHGVSALEWFAAYLGLWLMMLVSLWLGVIAAALTLSQRMGLSMSGFVTAPSFAYAGVTFPVMAMPAAAKIWAYCLPLTHYIHMHIALLQMGASARQALPVLGGFIVATLVLLSISALLTLRAFRLPERWGAR